MPIFADFTSDVTQGAGPLTVNFFDTSTGAPDRWIWDFGDGSPISNDQNPTHIYVTDGFFTVTLKAFKFTTVDNVYLATNDGQFNRRGATRSSEQAAWDSFLATPFILDATNRLVQYTFVSVSGSNWYIASKITNGHAFDLTAQGPFAHAVLRCQFLVHTGGSEGLVVDINGVRMPALATNMNVPYLDVTDRLGQILFLTGTEVNNFTDRLGFGKNVGSYGFAILIRPDPVVFNTYVEITNYSDSSINVKDRYILVGESFCGKGWAMISFEVIPLGPGDKNLVVQTDKQAHLFIGYMIGPPPKDRVWRQKYGMPHRCQPLFNIGLDGQLEQLEGGDSKEHTFELKNIPLRENLWLILFGTQCGDDSKGMSPLFAIDNS